MRRRERALAKRDPVMARLIDAAGPCLIEAAHEREPFETLASAIAHQQLNGAVAKRILERFTAIYAPAEFPHPSAVVATEEAALRAAGFSFSKIRALHDLADKCVRGIVPTVAEMHALDNEAIIERITQVRGIGRWTVEMLLMFQLARPDVLPVDDYGVCNGFRLAYGLKGMPRPRALAEFGERWAPYRSVAAWYLWRAVDLAREKKLPRAGRAPRVALRVSRAKPRKVKPQRVKPKRAKPRHAKRPRTKRKRA
jgi:DNA-3-methyladenine glycosylase II